MITSPSRKAYIGKTIKTVSGRWAQHKCSARIDKEKPHCRILVRAIRKYGAGVMHVETLLEAPDELLDEYEVKFIDMYGTSDRRFGYNIAPGGGTPPCLFDASKQRLRQTLATPEARETKARAMRVVRQRPEFHTSEYIQRASAAQRKANSRSSVLHNKSIARKTMWSDPSKRNARIKAIKAAWADPAKKAARLEKSRAKRCKHATRPSSPCGEGDGLLY